MVDLATVGIAVDATQVIASDKALDNLAAAGDRAATSIENLEKVTRSENSAAAEARKQVEARRAALEAQRASALAAAAANQNLSNSTGESTRATLAAERQAQAFIAAMERQAATLGMTALQAKAYEASQLSLTRAQEAQVVAALRTIDAHQKQEEMMSRVNRTAGLLTAGVVALAGGLVLSAMHAVNNADQIGKLSEKTGIAAERLGQFQFAAKLTDTTLEALARSFQRLPRSLMEARDSNSEAGRGFAFLGIDPAQLQTQEQAIDKIADAITRVQDPMAKSAALQMIFKRNGDDLLLFFNKGAEGLAELSKEGEYYNKITGLSAEQAGKLKDDLDRLHFSSGALGKTLASDLVPWVNNLIGRFLEARKEAGGLYETLKLLASVGTLSGDRTWSQDLSEMSAKRDQLMARRNRVAGQSSWFNLGRDTEVDKLDRDIASVNRSLQYATNRAIAEGGDSDNFDARFNRPASSVITGMPDSREKKERAASKGKEDPYIQLIASSQERIAIIQAEEGQIDKITEAEKLWLKAIEDVGTGKLKFNADRLAEYENSLNNLKLLEQERATRKLLQEDMKRQAEAQEAINRANAQGAAQNTAFFQSMNATTKALKEDTELLELELKYQGTFGLSLQDQIAKTTAYRNERELLIETRKLDAEYSRAAVQAEGEEAAAFAKRVEQLDKWYEEQKRILPEVISARNSTRQALDTANAVENEWKGVWQSVDSAARDAFINVEHRGVDSLKRIGNTIKTSILDVLYQMTLKKWIFQIFGQVTGSTQGSVAPGTSLLQDSSGSSAGGGSFNIPGGGDIFSKIGSSTIGQSIFGSATAYSAAVPGLSFGGEQAAMLAEQTGVFGFEGLSATAGAGGSSLLGAGASAFSSYVPYIGALIQLAQGNVKGAIGTAAGAYIGSMIFPGIGTAIGAIIGSLASSLFGGKKVPSKMIDSGGLGYTGGGEQFYSRGSQGAMDVASGISKALQEVAGQLNATLPSYAIGFGSNTGKNSKEPNFDLSASVGTGTDMSNQRNVFHSGEDTGQFNKLDQATIELRSAQAVISIIREADMPKYLKDFFDALKPATEMTKQDVDATLQYVQQLKSAHEVLTKIIDISGIDTTADAVIDMYGNLQTAIPLFQSYLENFFTATEKHDQALKSLEETMTKLGVATIPKTREEFRDLVEAQDLTTDSGKATFQALIALNGMFAAVTPEIEDTTDALGSLTAQLTEAQDAALEAMRDQLGMSRDSARAAHEAASGYRELAKSLDDQKFGLRQGNLSPLLPGQKLGEARSNLDSMFQRALSGDRDALGGLGNAASNFLDQSRTYNASSSQYSMDFDRVMRMLDEAGVSSNVFAGQKDYDAALLDIQTAALEELQKQMSSDNPNLIEMQKQTDLLEAVQELLTSHGQVLTTINSSVVDQTGQVIQGNSYIDAQTGEITGVRADLATQTQSLLAGSYTVADPNTGRLVTLTTDQTGAVTAVRDAVTGQTTSLLAGTYTVTDPATGRVYQATVDQTGAVVARIADGITQQIAGNELIDAQTGEVRAIANATRDQTGQVVSGNRTQDAIRDLAEEQTGYTEDQLRAFAETQIDQRNAFGQMTSGLDSTVTALNRLIAIMEEREEEQAAQDERDRLRAEAQSRLATASGALNALTVQKAPLVTSVEEGIQGIQALARAHNVSLLGPTGQSAYFRINPDTGAFESDYTSIQFRAEHPEEADHFRANFYAQGGVYDQTFGKGGALQTLFTQIAAQQKIVDDLRAALDALPSHAEGLTSVPFNGYIARLHAQEMVVDAPTALALKRYGIGSSASYNPAELAALVAASRETSALLRQLIEESRAEMRTQTREIKEGMRESTREGEFVRANYESAKVRR